QHREPARADAEEGRHLHPGHDRRGREGHGHHAGRERGPRGDAEGHATCGGASMNDLLLGAYIFVLAIFVGNEVISKVPTTLHTPLMSGANAIHGIIIVGAMLVATAVPGPLGAVLGFLGVVLGTINVVGGFVVTDRMLQMFKTRPKRAEKK